MFAWHYQAIENLAVTQTAWGMACFRFVFACSLVLIFYVSLCSRRLKIKFKTETMQQFYTKISATCWWHWRNSSYQNKVNLKWLVMIIATLKETHHNLDMWEFGDALKPTLSGDVCHNIAMSWFISDLQSRYFSLKQYICWSCQGGYWQRNSKLILTKQIMLKVL